MTLTTSGEIARRQLVVAATLWAGDALVDGPCACWWHGTRAPSYDPDVVHLVVPRTSPARSRDFVRIRRSVWRPSGERAGTNRYVALPLALLVTAGRLNPRASTALLAEGVQRRRVDVDHLVSAMALTPPRGRARLWSTLEDLGAGARSAPEADLRRLVLASPVLPEPMWNPLVRLPGGHLVSPDALWVSRGLVHEVNGQQYHAWGEAFEDMQTRHDALTAAGFVVLHNTPRRIGRDPAAVIAEIERCYLSRAGCGLPPGVRLEGELARL